MKRHIAHCLAAATLLAGTSLANAQSTAHDIDPSAALENVAVSQKNVRKASSEQLVVFEVSLKNLADEPKLYSVIVYIPGVGAGEGFAPDKEGSIAPGEVGSASVAILSNTMPGDDYQVTVRAVAER